MGRDKMRNQEGTWSLSITGPQRASGLRARAEELRAIAENEVDEYLRRVMLDLADDFEAEAAERKES